jgi:hypothetical protein
MAKPMGCKGFGASASAINILLSPFSDNARGQRNDLNRAGMTKDACFGLRVTHTHPQPQPEA